jgi:hypothetical protein
MESILTVTGFALTAAASFSLALFLGWLTLAGFLRLLPAGAPVLRLVAPVRTTARIAASSGSRRRARVLISETRSRSGKRYTVRTA